MKAPTPEKELTYAKGGTWKVTWKNAKKGCMNEKDMEMTLTQLANQEGWSNDKFIVKTQQMWEPMVDPGYSEMKNDIEISCDSFIPKEPEFTREPEVRIDPNVALPHSKARWESVRRVRKKVNRPVLKMTMDRQKLAYEGNIHSSSAGDKPGDKCDEGS